MRYVASRFFRVFWGCQRTSRTLKSYLDGQDGRFAVLRGRKVVGFFDDPVLAAADAWDRFSDGQFSIVPVEETVGSSARGREPSLAGFT